MDNDLSGKNALVIGGSRGIGRAVVEDLAAAGAAVAFSYVNNKEAAATVVAELAADGRTATAYRADLGDVAEVRGLFAQAEDELGPLDIVVANAALAIMKPLAECTEEDYDNVFGTNAKGTFFALQEAARRVRDGGRIITVSTGGTQMWFTDLSLYLGSKGAVEQFSRVLSRELGPRGVTVNVVSPGFTDTDLLPDRDRAVAESMSALGRVGAPQDVAAVVAYLASDAARWLTGQNLAAAGGVF
ncbi:SDR family oxidoreductase [Kribbella sp. NPDC026611]|uniref:SDR family oxidoreductase n=1 Tax=Kribbella sp. NPDC026611 TaxID=3154911 RepID=UPI00340520C0